MRISRRNAAPARTVTVEVTYPDGGEGAWPWSDKFTRENAWRGLEQWLKGARRHVHKYGVSVLIIKERGKTIAIYNAISAPRVQWRGSDTRIFRAPEYPHVPWLHGKVDESEVEEDTFASRDGLIGEVPPLPEIVGRTAERNSRTASPIQATIEMVAKAPVGTILHTADGNVAWRKVEASKSGWSRQMPSASSDDGWKAVRPPSLHEFMAITRMINNETMYVQYRDTHSARTNRRSR